MSAGMELFFSEYLVGCYDLVLGEKNNVDKKTLFIVAGKQCCTESQGRSSFSAKELGGDKLAKRDILYYVTSCRRNFLNGVGVYLTLFSELCSEFWLSFSFSLF